MRHITCPIPVLSFRQIALQNTMVTHQMCRQVVTRLPQCLIVKIYRLSIDAFTSLKNRCGFGITPRFARSFPVHRKLSSSTFYGAFPLPHDTPHITEPQEKA